MDEPFRDNRLIKPFTESSVQKVFHFWQQIRPWTILRNNLRCKTKVVTMFRGCVYGRNNIYFPYFKLMDWSSDPNHKSWPHPAQLHMHATKRNLLWFQWTGICIVVNFIQNSPRAEKNALQKAFSARNDQNWPVIHALYIFPIDILYYVLFLMFCISCFHFSISLYQLWLVVWFNCKKMMKLISS